jgi:hypothetical protein
VQVFGTQVELLPHTLDVPPPPQVSASSQVPQLRLPPHPSPAGPQLKPWSAHVLAVHEGVPHTPEVPPPPQVLPLGQPPQLTTPPQPLLMIPHVTLADEHVTAAGQPLPLSLE